MFLPPSASEGLSTLPPEVIENIGFFAATTPFLGPPSSLAALALTSRWIYACLSLEHNPHLYARIFRAKFDTAAIARRDSSLKEPIDLAAEFKRRCICLNQLKNRDGATQDERGEAALVSQVIWTAYLMLLEDDGLNRRQLLEYADVREWLEVYWFHVDGASGGAQSLLDSVWPTTSPARILAMWMMWYTMDLDKLLSSPYLTTASRIFRLYSIAATRYRLTNNLRLVVFDAPPTLHTPVSSPRGHKLVLPPIAPAALLAYFALTAKVERSLPPTTTSLVPFGWSPSTVVIPPISFNPDSHGWEPVWNRMNPATPNPDVSACFIPGSFEDVWEGTFEYIEFNAYARIIGGAGPMAVHDGITAHHKQTWKMHEFHLLGTDNTQRLPEGDPLHSYLPTGTHITVTANGREMEVKTPEMDEVLTYMRPREGRQDKVVDIIVSGEGHSAWGEFTLCGRVRPEDGLISLMKQYNDDNRGSWLYRGYLIGNKSGIYIGRWRDTLTTVDVAGYEGGFVMNRRSA